MRIAVCFSGQIRTGVDTCENIKNFIGQLLPSCDFFIHTWDVNTFTPYFVHSGHDIYINVDKSTIDEIKNIYNPISIKVDSFKSWMADVKDVKGHPIPLFASAYMCNELKCEYESLHNFKYDYVLKLRFDVVFRPYQKLALEIFYASRHYPDMFHTCDIYNRLPTSIEDICWLSSSDTMNIAVNFYHELSSNNTLYYTDFQEYFQYYMNRSNIIVNGFFHNELYFYRNIHKIHNIGTDDIDDFSKYPEYGGF
jgi:hypothetical protein